MGVFAERFNKILAIRDIKPADLAKITGLSKPRISQYVNGVYVPKPEALHKIANALKVNPQWLTGESEIMENYTSLQAGIEIGSMLQKEYGKDKLHLFTEYLQINEAEREEIEKLLALYSKLDDLDRAAIIGAIRGMMEKMLQQEKYSVKKESLNA